MAAKPPWTSAISSRPSSPATTAAAAPKPSPAAKIGKLASQNSPVPSGRPRMAHNARMAETSPAAAPASRPGSPSSPCHLPWPCGPSALTAPMLRRPGAARVRAVASVVDDVGQQGQEAGALDGVGQLTLLLRADGRDAARHDLAALRQE